MLILIFLTMVFIAICTISLPLLNKEAIKINYIMILAFIFIAVSAPIYYFIGSPQSISLLESESQIDRTIEMLNVRLSEDPEDLDALRALAAGVGDEAVGHGVEGRRSCGAARGPVSDYLACVSFWVTRLATFAYGSTCIASAG